MKELIKNMSNKELLELKKLINAKFKESKSIPTQKKKYQMKHIKKEKSFFEKWDKVIKNMQL